MVVKLPGHDLLTGKVGAFYKRKREGGRQEWEISEEGWQDGADVDG